MQFTLFRKELEFPPAWAHGENHVLHGSIYVTLHISRHKGFHFSVSVANKSFSDRNPIKALLRALESETVGMAKYDALKDRVRSMGQWKNL